MESPITLLKSAVYETEGYSGTLQVVKACKIITDTLPFDKKNYILLEDPELLKHLILSLPLNPRAIDLIIYSMLEKFQYTHTFLKQLWMAFIFVASLEESAPKRVDTHLKTVQTGSRTLRSMRSKDLDESPMPPPNKEPLYNREIERNKEIIKLTTLNYTEKVIEIYFNKIRNKVAFKPDIQLLLKLFLTYTTSEKVIVKVCTILERVKGKDQNISFDHEFEEILLSKRRLTLDLQPRVKVSSEGLTASQKFRGTRPEIGTTNNIIMEEKASSPVSLKVIDNDSPRRMPTKEEIMTRTSGFDSDEQIDFDGEAREYNAVAFDKWLCNCEIQDVPLISKDDEIMDLILKKENLEAFLMFLLDPRGSPLSEMWKKMHNPEMDVYKEEEEMASRSIDTSNLSVKLQKIKDLKHFHPYVLRSYKAMQVICDTRNFKYITQTQKDVIEMFFTNMYTICTVKEGSNICNFNHLAKVTEYFLRKESHGSVHYLIRYNLLFKFLQNIGFQYVQHLFLTIFGCTEFSNDLDDEPLHNILQYCKITTFFVDLANAILSGEDTFDIDKLSVEFKPVEVEPLLRAPTESGVFSFPPEERAASYSMNFEAPFLVEETKGYHLDIDNLQSAMRAKRQTDLKKLRTMKTFLIDVKPGTGSYTERKVVKKQYPSLSEKKRHNFDENEEHEFDEIDEGEFGGEEKVVIDSGAMSARPFMKHKYSKSTTMGFESLRISPRNPKLKSPLIKGDKQKLELFNLINQQSPPVVHAAHTKSKASIQQSPIQIIANMPTGESPIPMASPHGFSTARNRGKKLSLPVIDTPNGADKDKNFHLYLASTNPKNATEPSQKGSKLNDSRKVKDSYEKVRSSSSESQMKLLRDLSDMKSPIRTKVTSDASMSEIIKDSRAPQKVTVANELKADTLNRKELKELNKLYPLSARDIIPNDMDIEAKKSEFGVENIKTTDHFALAGCEFLEELFRRAFVMPYQESKEDEDIPENDNEKKKRKKYHLKRNLGTINTDYTGLWDTIFQDDCKVFELLLKNYLIKIKMNPLGPINSGYVAGKLVNTILEKCTQKHPYIEKHTPKIIEICRKHFQYLCKMIIQSHAWLPREDFKVFLQAMQVQDLLGTGRLILVSTLNHIVHTDAPKNYDLLHQVNNTCWHTLILWFFSKKTNNLYQRLFYTILETALLNTDEKFILNLLFKLNIVSNMYTTWVGMCQNHVLLKENHIDSMLYYLKKIYKLVDSIAESRDNYRLLNDQLASSISWKALEPNLLPAKRRHSTAQSLRRKSKQSTKIHLIPTGSGFNKGPRSNSDNHKSPPHTNNPTGRTTRPSIRLGSPQAPHKPGKF